MLEMVFALSCKDHLYIEKRRRYGTMANDVIRYWLSYPHIILFIAPSGSKA